MADSRGRLATLIVTIVLLTLLVAFGSASLAIWLGGDWDSYRYGLTLTLKIMWGSWVVLFVAALLTHATFMGWKFRKARPGEGPAALMRAIAEGMKPSAWLKRGPDSFTITVVLVSLLGAAVLATVLIWILGQWSEDNSAAALGLTLKILWGTWWVLCIITVLVRVSIFKYQRNKAGYGKKPFDDGDEEDGPDKGDVSPNGDGSGTAEKTKESATDKPS